MIRRPNIITKLLTLLLACTAMVFAHGGFEHVGGTVVKLEKSVLTVKTTHGDVDVQLDAKTEITLNGKPAQAADLKQGAKWLSTSPKTPRSRSPTRSKSELRRKRLPMHMMRTSTTLTNS